MMNREFRNEWTKRLRSGEIQQARAKLQDSKGAQCCLGVLACVIGAKFETQDERLVPIHPTFGDMRDGDEEGRSEYLNLSTLAHVGLAADAQATFALMNDSGKTFAEIADEIERSDLESALKEVKFPGVEFSVSFDKGSFYLQLSWQGVCNYYADAMSGEWKGLKWLLSPHMTAGEVVQTAFKALLTAQEHETREQFKYKGVSIFDPHYDLDRLVALRRDPSSIQERDAA